MITLRDVPEQDYLAIDGAGPAAGPAFADAVERLYAAHFAAGGADVPLEGLWWTPGPGDPFDHDRPESWRWPLLVPAGLATTTIHVGGYEELPLAYAAVLGSRAWPRAVRAGARDLPERPAQDARARALDARRGAAGRAGGPASAGVAGERARHSVLQ